MRDRGPVHGDEVNVLRSRMAYGVAAARYVGFARVGSVLVLTRLRCLSPV